MVYDILGLDGVSEDRGGSGSGDIWFREDEEGSGSRSDMMFEMSC
jgi:hypothetical protein